MVVIAAVDRSNQAESVVREAAELATAFDEPLHLVHVMSRSEFLDREMSSARERGRPVEMDEIRRLAADHARDAATDIDTQYEAVGRVGDIVDNIANHAEKHDARYIVIGGRKRSPAGKAVFGSVAQDILLNSDRPVVAVFRQK